MVVQFDGEQSSSDGGSLLLGAIDRRIGLTKALSEELVDSDSDGMRDYRIKYDAFSNPSERLPIETAK